MQRPPGWARTGWWQHSSAAKGSYDMFDIRLHEVDEQLVLTEQRHVRADELPGLDRDR